MGRRRETSPQKGTKKWRNQTKRVMRGPGEGLPKQGIKPTKEGTEKAGAVGERNELSIRNSQIRKTSPFKFGERKLCG